MSEQEKEQALQKAFEEVRALHRMTFCIHDPENEVVIAASGRLRACFTHIKEIGVPSDLLTPAIGWLQKMEGSNQNTLIRHVLGEGIAQLRKNP